MPPSDRVVGVGYAIAAAFCMAAMDAASKLVVIDVAVAQVIALRAAFVLVLGWPMIRAVGIIAALRTANGVVHAIRAGVILVSMLGFLIGVRDMPLANASAIGLSAPLFMIVFARVILGEQVSSRQVFAAIVGFAGVVTVTYSGFAAAGWWPTTLIIGSAACFGLSMVLVRRLAGRDGDATMLLYSNLGVLAASAAAVPMTAQAMPALAIGWVGVMAICAFVGQIATFRAFRRAAVAVLAPVQYFELIFAALLGWLIWREAAGPAVWLGGALIVAGSVLAIAPAQAEKA